MKKRIKQLQPSDRPREKFLEHGAERLSDAELLAILIGSGSTDESSVQLMERVLADCDDNLTLLGKMTLPQLLSYKGIGDAKAVTIMAACELGRRRNTPKEMRTIATAEDLFSFMRPRMQDLDVEQAWAVFLNNSMKVIRAIRLSYGGMTSTLVDVRVLMREALFANATCIMLCHNHPSGALNPSREDKELTRQVQKAAASLEIRLLDHFIITDKGYYSFSSNNLI